MKQLGVDTRGEKKMNGDERQPCLWQRRCVYIHIYYIKKALKNLLIIAKKICTSSQAADVVCIFCENEHECVHETLDWQSIDIDKQK